MIVQVVMMKMRNSLDSSVMDREMCLRVMTTGFEGIVER